MLSYCVEHIGIAADDPEYMAAWYSTMLGFREFFRTDSKPTIIFLEDPSGAMIEVFPRKTGESRPGPGDHTGMHLALVVADLDEAVTDLESRGLEFSSETKDIFAGGKVRFFADPEGNRLHIVSRPKKPW